jgi:TonB family protein
MNVLALTVSVLLCVTSSVYAQSSLNEDPVFKTVLSRQIRYPVLAERTGVYGRIYACFKLDERGHVQNIEVLNSRSKYGFEQAVKKGLKLLPPLNPRYAGQYVVPIDFAYINYNDSSEPLLPSPQPLPTLYQQGRVVLKEIRIIGNSRTYRHDGPLKPTTIDAGIARHQYL